MLGLDGITLFLLTGVVQFGLLLAVRLIRYPDIDPLIPRLWIACHLSGSVAMFLVLNRRGSDQFWSVDVSNFLIYIYFSAQVLLIRRYLGGGLRRVFPLLAAIVLLPFFTGPLTTNEADRLAMVVGGSIVINLLMLDSLWHGRKKSRVVLFLLAANVLVGLGYVARFIEARYAEADYDFFNAGLGQDLGLLAFYIGIMVNGVGFILLIKERVDGELVRLATLDSLTEVNTRRSFVEYASAQLANASRAIHPVSLLLFDIDHFKRINDRYGHHVGDIVICEVVQAARDNLRAGDNIGRWGGEEFVVMLPFTPLDGAELFANRLREAVARLEIVVADHDLPLRVTISIGVAEHQPGDDVQAVVDRADTALYRAKNNGRNRVEVAELPSNDIAEARSL